MLHWLAVSGIRIVSQSLTGHQIQYIIAKRLTGDAPLASCSVETKLVTGDALLATWLACSVKTPHRRRSTGQLLSGGEARNRRRYQGQHVAAKTPHRRRSTGQLPVETKLVTGDALLATWLACSVKTPHRRRSTGQLLSGGEARNRRRYQGQHVAAKTPHRRRPTGQLLSIGAKSSKATAY